MTDAWRACVGTGRFDLALRRVTLVELTAVVDETPPWTDDDRIPGSGQAVP